MTTLLLCIIYTSSLLCSCKKIVKIWFKKLASWKLFYEQQLHVHGHWLTNFLSTHDELVGHSGLAKSPWGLLITCQVNGFIKSKFRRRGGEKHYYNIRSEKSSSQNIAVSEIFRWHEADWWAHKKVGTWNRQLTIKMQNECALDTELLHKKFGCAHPALIKVTKWYI